MAEKTAETRTISGTGVLKVPVSVVKPRYLSLLVNVTRLPTNPFNSYKYSPSRQRYATAVFLRGGYVVSEQPIDYDNRRLDFFQSESAEILNAIKCSYEGVLATFFNLGNSLQLPSISITNNIKDWQPLDFFWDEARFVCEADTSIEVKLLWDAYDVCPDDTTMPKKPPQPPSPPSKTPPGTPIGDLSPPYPNDTVTKPYPGDTTTPDQPGQGQSCVAATVTIDFVEYGAVGTPTGNDHRMESFAVWGIVQSVDITSTGDGATRQGIVNIICQGVVSSPCQPAPFSFVISQGSQYGTLNSYTVT